MSEKIPHAIIDGEERKRFDRVAYHRSDEAKEARRVRDKNRREIIRTQQRQWVSRNREKRAIQSKIRYDANPEKYREQKRKDYVKHREGILERNRLYAKANPDVCIAIVARRRARLLGNGGSYSRNEWEEIKEKQDHTCLMCGRREPEIRLTVDHIVPISKGGSNDIENIQGLCRSCNCSKKAKTLDLRQKGT